MTLLLTACGPAARPSGDPRAEITAMLERSAVAWNRGDLAAFMDDYARDSTLTYVSRGRADTGWQALYDGYERGYFAPGKSRDSLTFVDVRVHPLAPDVAYATARFQLLRGDSVTASGPFTLVLERRDGRWLILHDHTTQDPTP